MAPAQQSQSTIDFDIVDQSLQSLIQCLYEISVNVYKFDAPPNSSDILVRQITDLVTRFQDVEKVADTLKNVYLPREVVGQIKAWKLIKLVFRYVEHGRNPDIYTREFVELVVKHNQLLNGKQRAFQDFSNILAEQIKESFPELKDDVAKVLDGTGVFGNNAVPAIENEIKEAEHDMAASNALTNGSQAQTSRT